MKIDLHIHSVLSDGTDTPEAIVDKAERLGINCISITDHDCVKANAIAKEYAGSNGIQYINGVELSTYSTQEIHLLGYAFDENNSALLESLDYFESKRKERAMLIIDRLYSLGIKIDKDTLPADSASVGRLHIAKIMVDKGYVSSIPEAFDKYLGANGKAYYPSKRITPIQGVKLIKEAGGYAVIAHPLRFVQQRKLEMLVDGLKPFGLEGVEAYYPTHDETMNKTILSIAKRKRLIATGGTDYHGVNRNIEIGSVEYNLDAYTASNLGIKI